MVSESQRSSSSRSPLLLNPSPCPPSSLPIDPMAAAAAAAGSEVSDDDARLVHVGDPDRTADRTRPSIRGNAIRTTKYNVLTFIPRNLYEQFRRVAYIYFFILACLNQIPQLTVFGQSTAFVPLGIVLFLTAVKDGYEDWRRHRSDKTENNRLASVLQGSGFQPKKWKDIRVGEIIRAGADHTLPCDMVLLATSDPTGAAYVNTINLDGESNLKTRYAMQETASRPPESWLPDSSSSSAVLIRCEPPNLNIYGFQATIEVDGRRMPLGPTNIILRGCEIKNTSWIVGVAVYTGMDTKVMLNNSGPPSKRSRLETRMNREIIILAVIMVGICTLIATLTGIWLHTHQRQLDTLPYYRRADFSKGGQQDYKYSGLVLEIVIAFLMGVFNFQNFIPISLYISMEISRLTQSYKMTQDKSMCYEDIKFQCRALNINEDLGQIRYVFSDKTGTLTENKMVFQCASVRAVDYSNGELPVPGEVAPHPTLVDAQVWRPKMLVRTDRKLSYLLETGKGTEEWTHANNFFLAVAACNTIVPQVVETSDPAVKLLDYQGESPDEQALVYAAAAYGFVLIERTSGHIVINALGEMQRFDVLGLHEFDSVRKRMSVIVRCPDKTLKLFVKGADNAMVSIIDKSLDLDIVRDTETHLHAYSSLGLRTLVIGMKELSRAEYEDWWLTYEKASTAISGRMDLLQAVAVKVECNIRILGATGIEDKLQQGVPEAIESIRQAGIKVWVLTGDKQETAISIGYSCKLLIDNMTQIIINSHSKESCKKSLEDAISLLKKPATVKDGRAKENSIYSGVDGRPAPARVPHALIIDGPTLVHILETELEEELFNVATACDVVLCCRVAPLQKAGIVALIKKRTSDMTLSIGDGANDVSMIQMADVGIGISGQEGRQAVMASDFSMGQFRFLVPLLLVHGHWNYQRMSYMILYNYYRNAVFVFVIVWYVFYSAFGLQNPITETSGLLYSALYTALPTIMVGIHDQDVSRGTLLRYPQLYGPGLRGESYTPKLFVLIMLDSLWQSLVLFYTPFFFYQHNILDGSSFGDIWILGVVGLVNIHLAMDVNRWNWIIHATIWGCSIITVICVVALDAAPAAPGYMAVNHLATSGLFWLCLLCVFVLALLPRFTIKVFSAYLQPSDLRIAREYQKFWKSDEAGALESSTNHFAEDRRESTE